MRVNGAVLLLLLVLCLALAFALGQVGSQALGVWAEQSERPKSATDTILQSRQTPPIHTGNSGRAAWLGAGLLALTLVGLASAVFLLRGGAELLRQWRLVRRRPSRRQHRTPYLPENGWPELPTTTTVRTLPEVDDVQVVDPRD